MIEIKRYQNRKLYSINESKYVTIQDLSKLLKQGQSFNVTDFKTQANMTKQVLLKALQYSSITENELIELIKR